MMGIKHPGKQIRFSYRFQYREFGVRRMAKVITPQGNQ